MYKFSSLYIAAYVLSPEESIGMRTSHLSSYIQANQWEKEEKRVNDTVAKLEKQIAQARISKDKSDKERDAAVSGEEQAKVYASCYICVNVFSVQ